MRHKPGTYLSNKYNNPKYSGYKALCVCALKWSVSSLPRETNTTCVARPALYLCSGPRTSIFNQIEIWIDFIICWCLLYPHGHVEHSPLNWQFAQFPLRFCFFTEFMIHLHTSVLSNNFIACYCVFFHTIDKISLHDAIHDFGASSGIPNAINLMLCPCNQAICGPMRVAEELAKISQVHNFSKHCGRVDIL